MIRRTVKVRGAQRAAVVPPKRSLRERINAAMPLGLAGVIVCFIIGGVIYLPRVLDAYPIQSVGVDGVKDDRRQQEVRVALAELVSGENFFSVSLNHLYREVSAIAWVEDVEIRRQWPNRLVLKITERVPVAVWNDSELVSSSGQPFRALAKYSVTDLPHLSGPEDRLASVMDYYHSMSKVLGPAGLQIRSMAVDPRLTAVLELSDNSTLVVDRVQYVSKLRRYARLHQILLVKEEREVARVDLRYADGVAVKWRDASNQQAAKES